METQTLERLDLNRREYQIGTSKYCEFRTSDGLYLWSVSGIKLASCLYMLDNYIAALQAMRSDLEALTTPPDTRVRPLSGADRTPEPGDALFFNYRNDRLRVVKSINGSSFTSEDGREWLWSDKNLIYAFRKDGGPLTTTDAPK